MILGRCFENAVDRETKRAKARSGILDTRCACFIND